MTKAIIFFAFSAISMLLPSSYAAPLRLRKAGVGLLNVVSKTCCRDFRSNRDKLGSVSAELAHNLRHYGSVDGQFAPPATKATKFRYPEGVHGEPYRLTLACKIFDEQANSAHRRASRNLVGPRSDIDEERQSPEPLELISTIPQTQNSDMSEQETAAWSREVARWKNVEKHLQESKPRLSH